MCIRDRYKRVDQYQVLRIDLTAGTAAREDVPKEVLSSFIGGKGLAAHYLAKELPSGESPDFHDRSHLGHLRRELPARSGDQEPNHRGIPGYLCGWLLGLGAEESRSAWNHHPGSIGYPFLS